MAGSKGMVRLTMGWVVLFCAVALAVKLVWIFIIPSLFPGAVSNGLVIASLSWITVIKISIIIVGIMLIRDLISKKNQKRR